MINIAIIGLGNIGSKRFDLLKKNNYFNILALVDIKFSRGFKKKNKKINLYKDYKKILLSENNLDIVFVATNPKSSFLISQYFLKNNINVFIEKPPCFNFSQYKKLNNLADKKNLLLKVGFNLLFDNGIKILKKYIDLSYFGKIYHIHAEYLYGTSRSNTNNVGSFMDVGIHLFYLTDYLVGRLKPLQVYLNNYEIKNNLDDNGSAYLISNNNISINLNFSLTHWENRFNYKIICEKGMLELSGLPKWGNQKLSIAKRKYPSGLPTKKNLYFKKDKSFESEIKNLRTIFRNKNKYKFYNSKDFSVMNTIKNSLLRCSNKKLVKYFYE